MAKLLKNRVKVSASSAGTADFGVGSAKTGFQTPAGAGYSNGDTFPYTAESADRSEWETGLATYSTTGPTVARTTVRQSSNSGSKVDFSAAPTVFVDPLAEELDLPRALPSRVLSGLVTSNGTDTTNDIDISAGFAISQNGFIMELASAVGKQLDSAYASGGTPGTPTGGRFDSSIANGTWHVFLISNGVTTGIGFSQSLDPTGAANGPSGYTESCRIASLLRESAALVQYTQNGDEFLRNAPAEDYSANGPGTGAVTVTLSVPTGLKVDALMSAIFTNTSSSSNTYVLVTSLDQSNTVPSASALDGRIQAAGGTGASTNIIKRIRTNTSGQIRYRQSASSGSHYVAIATHGWVDMRGRAA